MSASPVVNHAASLSRRGLLKGMTGSASAAAALSTFDTLVAQVENTDSGKGPLEALTSADNGQTDVLERMRAELLRALEKEPKDRRWVMVIDLRKCIGCHACTIACVAENKLPPGVVYRPVLEEEWGTYPNVGRRFTPKPCMQCENPPCTPVCPTNATYINEDGVVVVDYDQCIGCRACLTACPYAARTSDFGLTYNQDMPEADGMIVGREGANLYERIANFEYSEPRERTGHESPIGNARKCHFCLHRVRVGELPACVTSCVGRATLFGDANDPTSVVSEMIAQPNVMRLKEELGTKPKVYYLV
jgi:Fe-S-cluster-containing dehydrogenase component